MTSAVREAIARKRRLALAGRRVAAGVSVLLSASLLIAARREASAAAQGTPGRSDTDLVVREMCGKSIALLGESPLHGFGKTLQFKVEVARRLVDECHYRAFFIESGIYDFLNIQKTLKSGGQVTPQMLTAAIGGLWATREVEPLIPFLLERAHRGVLTLGGLDDQLARGTYAQRDMPADLVKYLADDAKGRCLAILQRHTLWQYTDDAPYSARDKEQIVGCLDAIAAKLSGSKSSDAPFREYDLAAVASLRRSLARDFSDNGPTGVDPASQSFNARDQSMYMNFQWLMSRLPANTKVIVWAANVHVAKALSVVTGLENRVPLGSYIRREFADRSFALGFSAYAGSYSMVRQPVRQLSAAPPASLEGQAFAKDSSETQYFTINQLRSLGAAPARLTGVDFRTARWNEVLDGVVVFREERPPGSSQ